MVKNWEVFLGQKIKLVYDDGEQPFIKVGILEDVGAEFLIIKTDLGDQVVAISRIIRLEVLE